MKKELLEWFDKNATALAVLLFAAALLVLLWMIALVMLPPAPRIG